MIPLVLKVRSSLGLIDNRLYKSVPPSAFILSNFENFLKDKSRTNLRNFIGLPSKGRVRELDGG